MRILIFSPYYPPHTGGLESHSDEFNQHLSSAGVDITVFTPCLPVSAQAREVLYERVTIVRFPAIEIVHNYPFPQFWKKTFWQAWREVQRPKYDLVLSRTRFFFTSLMAWQYARKVSIPWVHIEHGSDFARFNSSFKTLLGKFYDLTIGAFILQRSDLNIANSKASANFVKQLSQRTDCRVIYRGVEKDTIQNIAPHSFFSTHFPGKTVIGFIGRLIDGKGVADLLEAFSTLNTDTSICALVGDGPERARLEKLITQKNLSGSVVFFGEKPFAEAIALLKSFDIFVNPSYTEGIPTAVIEAALCHKAIITTDVGGTKEIITGEDDGFLIPPHNREELGEKLTLLLSDSALRRSLGERAFVRVEQKFDWHHATKEYLTLFHKLLP